MTQSLLNNVVQRLNEELRDADESNDFMTISVRPNLKNEAMLRVLLKLSQKKASALLSTGISEELFNYIQKRKANAVALQNTIRQIHEHNSNFSEQETGRDCISKCEEAGIISTRLDIDAIDLGVED